MRWSVRSWWIDGGKQIIKAEIVLQEINEIMAKLIDCDAEGEITKLIIPRD